MDLIVVMISILILLFIGYATGRRIGIKEGFKKGVDYAPLEMRMNMLSTGECPLCKDGIEKKE